MKFDTTDKLGKVLKSHGKDGELIISGDKGLSEDFLKMESIFIEINGGLVPFFIEHIMLKSTQTAILKLEDIDSIEAANELTGCNWYLPQKEWEKLKQSPADSYESLVGFTMIDQNDNEIGKVEEVLQIPSNMLLQVRHGDNLIEVPVNEETIYEIDEEDQILKNHIPEGLLEI
ncbi:MAG: ribosome maturation factor RimM [Bacteroidales bacterium]|nr:16S rRNA processing protein RimM [Bacteroidales bacterium]